MRPPLYLVAVLAACNPGSPIADQGTIPEPPPATIAAPDRAPALEPAQARPAPEPPAPAEPPPADPPPPAPVVAGADVPPEEPAGNSREASPCSSEEHRQFDFWVGTWTVTNPKGVVVGVNRIQSAHRGCAIIEYWKSARGGGGTSINYWDSTRKRWVQTWVDGSGAVIQLEGGLEEGAMTLGGTYTRVDGTTTLLRGTWTPLPDGRVRQLFEESNDSGASWSTWFDGYYARK